jgi:hypothetical protein
MRRERALKVVLVLAGLLFSAGIYPLVMVTSDSSGLVANQSRKPGFCGASFGSFS